MRPELGVYIPEEKEIVGKTNLSGNILIVDKNEILQGITMSLIRYKRIISYFRSP